MGGRSKKGRLSDACAKGARKPFFVYDSTGLSYVDGDMRLRGDFSKVAQRATQAKLPHEMLVKASKVKECGDVPIAIDATAGLGDDSFLLAAAGFEVHLFECNSVVADLLEDAIRRALKDPALSNVASRMHLHRGDSIKQIPLSGIKPDLVLLDPMFPAKQKNAVSKKKLQMIQGLEKPCDDEQGLMDAAIGAKPQKVVVKRPLKGPFLAGMKPSHSQKGKTIRYDCYVFPENRR